MGKRRKMPTALWPVEKRVRKNLKRAALAKRQREAVQIVAGYMDAWRTEWYTTGEPPLEKAREVLAGMRSAEPMIRAINRLEADSRKERAELEDLEWYLRNYRYRRLEDRERDVERSEQLYASLTERAERSRELEVGVSRAERAREDELRYEGDPHRPGGVGAAEASSGGADAALDARSSSRASGLGAERGTRTTAGRSRAKRKREASEPRANPAKRHRGGRKHRRRSGSAPAPDVRENTHRQSYRHHLRHQLSHRVMSSKRGNEVGREPLRRARARTAE